ncbi:MAG: hypothetical protein Edafosvirus11_27 [Edafosvirus sp.]|uniref:Uncharacterized protein n=1 Tax=Edafosvirus sp. TaxID=2487765 RepID=A0A3G4ZU15_9VIRU|nr:MAG: hypothetical protein Edafosvirus11_27 [Edafosvirus sp.]
MKLLFEFSSHGTKHHITITVISGVHNFPTRIFTGIVDRDPLYFENMKNEMIKIQNKELKDWEIRFYENDCTLEANYYYGSSYQQYEDGKSFRLRLLEKKNKKTSIQIKWLLMILFYIIFHYILCKYYSA